MVCFPSLHLVGFNLHTGGVGAQFLEKYDFNLIELSVEIECTQINEWMLRARLM